jgi:hypothetical protein
MPVPLCPRCGKAEKKRHICTGSGDPTLDARKSVRRQEFRESRNMSAIEVEEEVREKLDEIRARLVRETGKNPVRYSEAIAYLFKFLPVKEKPDNMEDG